MLNKLFFVDTRNNQLKTYSDLLSDIRSFEIYNQYSKQDSYYSVFLNIIVSMLLGREITLLDQDFSESETSALIGDSSIDKDRYCLDVRGTKSLKIDACEDLIDKIGSVSDQWKITLFTSGTTGRPKKISHSFNSIARFIKQSPAHMDDIWGFAYNPTHMAGLQVFFQSILNANTIVRLFKLPSSECYEQIKKYRISNISATPTFYRLLLNDRIILPSVKKITSGGEKFDVQLSEKLRRMFPNSSFTNVYASTEAGSLFASKGDTFTLKEIFSGNIKIENSELLIHQNLLGDSESYSLEGRWYHTGDIVDLINEEPLTFKFVSRKNEMINVGGYKVNPAEVEEAVRDIEGVKDSKVYSKSNSILGNIIYCDIVTDTGNMTEAYVRKQLSSNLQEYKIPRIIKFVQKISTTRTGKISRQ